MMTKKNLLDVVVLRIAEALPVRCKCSVNWRSLPERQLWREMVAAVLGSAVSFPRVIRALHYLDEAGLLDPGTPHRCYEACVAICLRRRAGYRFPASRAHQITLTAATVYGEGGTLRMLLQSFVDPLRARRELVAKCAGLGPKQASLFLRNVGFSDHAILDRHLLAYLKHKNRVDPSVEVVSSIAKYEALEESLREDAAQLALTIVELDIAVWLTMRALKNRQTAWA